MQMRAVFVAVAIATSLACSDPDASGGDAASTDAGGLADAITFADAATFPDATTFPDAETFDDAAEPEDDAAEPEDASDPDAAAMDASTLPTSCTLPPGLSTPGEYGCIGCPASTPPPASFTQALGAVTFAPFSGTITGTTGNGRFDVHGTGTQQIFGTVPTDANGDWSVTIPLFCGVQTVSLTWCNEAGTYTIVYEVTTDVCTTPDIRVTLLWDDLGYDWELHLIRPGGRINDDASDCTWTSCIGTSPDWGVIGDPSDDPSKDVDNTGQYGPENILLRGPENGVFTVMVEHWATGSPLSDGLVILNVAGQVHQVTIEDLAPQFVRTAATITWPGGIVATSTIVHDCTNNWSSGCRDLIP